MLSTNRRLVHGESSLCGKLTGSDRITFKRRQKSSSRFSLRNLLPFGSGASSAAHTPSAQPLHTIPPSDNRDDARNPGTGDNKNENLVDWYIEGPGRRVGYDNLTAIDWIFEYAKERQHIRHLYSSSTGLLGHIRQILNASYVWFVLVFTGIAVGVIAASIDVVSNWLGDIKTGYCRSGEEGGKFYLNRNFCCWGYDSMHSVFGWIQLNDTNTDRFPGVSECKHWIPWGTAFGDLSKSGSYVVEYILFTLYSVCLQIST